MSKSIEWKTLTSKPPTSKAIKDAGLRSGDYIKIICDRGLFWGRYQVVPFRTAMLTTIRVDQYGQCF